MGTIQSYDEFCIQVLDLGVCLTEIGAKYDRGYSKDTSTNRPDSETYYGEMYKKTKHGEDAVYLEWVTSESEGGNCWGGTARNVGGEPEPDFEDLYKILESFCPDLPFILFRQLLKLVVISEEDVREYYGNGVTYGQKHILLKDLYNFLKENNQV